MSIGLLAGIELYIEEDDRYMPRPDLSHFGLTRPWDGNFYFMLLACREGACDIVLANRESVDATPGARRFFEQAVGLMEYDIQTKIAAEVAKQGTSFPRHLVRLGAEVL